MSDLIESKHGKYRPTPHDALLAIAVHQGYLSVKMPDGNRMRVDEADLAREILKLREDVRHEQE